MATGFGAVLYIPSSYYSRSKPGNNSSYGSFGSYEYNSSEYVNHGILCHRSINNTIEYARDNKNYIHGYSCSRRYCTAMCPCIEHLNHSYYSKQAKQSKHPYHSNKPKRKKNKK